METDQLRLSEMAYLHVPDKERSKSPSPCDSLASSATDISTLPIHDRTPHHDEHWAALAAVQPKKRTQEEARVRERPCGAKESQRPPGGSNARCPSREFGPVEHSPTAGIALPRLNSVLTLAVPPSGHIPDDNAAFKLFQPPRRRDTMEQCSKKTSRQ
ncbi:hypothetical protein MRX96_003957 [Rhipicephalus microplus]